MVTARQTTDAVETLENQPLADEAWAPDRGYVIVVLRRPLADEGNIFHLIDAAKHLDLTGEIRIETGFMHKGRERDTIHFEHVDRFDDGRGA